MGIAGSYRPGTWAGVTTARGWLLADLPVTDERIAQVWTALRDGHGTDRALDALLGNGLTELPSFALAVVDEGRLRLVVRRDAVIVVGLGDEEQVVDGPPGSWQDVELPLPVDRLQLRSEPYVAAERSSAGVPVGLGIAQASRIDLIEIDLLEVDAESSVAAVSGPATALAPESAPEPVTAPEVAETEAQAGPAQAGPAQAGPAEAAVPEPDPDSTPQDYSDLFAGTEDRDAFIARLVSEQDGQAETESAADEDSADGADRADTVEEPSPPSPAFASDTAIWTGDLDPLLSGGADEATPPLPERSFLPSPPTHQSGPPATGTPPSPPRTAPESRASGLIDGLPWLTGTSSAPATSTSTLTPPPTPPPPPPPPPTPPTPSAPPATDAAVADESAELTVSRTELLAAMGNHGVVGPSVLALWCPAGHPTPPEQDRCRQCGVAVEGSQQPTEIPRPALGSLRSSSGEAVVLDRDIIFGRAPQASASRAASQPHLVKIADPGISRNHLHVALDGWQVLVRDLGSANGTEIQLPEREVEKLRANEDYLLESGTMLLLAGDVRYTFEISS